ncbi:MAG: sigma-70 family RNA polymerase sigma factor [Pseudomonadota bacterium]
MDELEIIRAVKAGDTRSYALLVERYHRPLLAFIFKIIGDRQLTEDIGQEVFLNIYKKIQRFDETKGASFSAWIFTIARNNCISALRRRGIEKPLDIDLVADLLADGRKNPEENLLARERKSVVAAALQQVPEPFRKTISMSLAGCSSATIAHSQNITVGTVKSRLFRAKERMRLLVGACFGYKGNSS